MAKILIVDDRPTNREYLVKLLGYGGHRLHEAADGAEALAAARSVRPDLIIADILMPTMDGYEFVRLLRLEPEIAETPVIFFTAHYHEREAQNLARACGVFHVLTKPAEPEEVLRAVEAALQGGAAVQVPAEPPPPPEEFDREHLRLVTDKLSEKADELRAVNERLTALIELGLRLGSELDPQRLLQSLADGAREIVGARYAAVGIVDGERSGLRFFAVSGMDAAAAARLGTLDSRRPPLSAILDECCCSRLHLPHGHPGMLELPPFPSCRSFLGAPVISPTRVYGWLCLFDRLGADQFSSEDERLAGILASQAGRIYENGSLYADVIRHAHTLEAEIAERKQAQEAQRESEEQMRQAQQRLQHVLASSPAVIFTLSGETAEDLHLTWVSDNLSEMLGYSAVEAIEPDWWFQGVHPEDRARVLEEVAGRLFTRRRLADEYRFRHRDGSYRWIASEMRLLPGSAGGPPEVFGSWSDITERRELEEQFRQAQKMEAVGRLAGGVAHDFNNMLCVINGYAGLLLQTIPSGDPARDHVGEMSAAGNRAAALTRQLLAFSRKAIVSPRVLDLRAVVADMESMLRRIIGEDVELTFVSAPDCGHVNADPSHIEQVLLNLAVNSRDAMPQGGRLTVELRNVDLDETYTREHAESQPGPHVLLAVSDTGCGMDASTVARIWEPFFTTKGTGGTGLGLATVYGIVKQSGGHATVYSELGRGTTLKVYLPRVEEEVASPSAEANNRVMPTGAETLLLVEDEPAVRGLARRILEECGYTIIEARDAEEALRRVEAHPEPIDLLITDVVMPRLSGRELAQQLAQRRPGLKVLFVSGYTDDAVVRHGILEAEVEFLQKPFSPQGLAQKVRAVLDASPR